MSTARAQRGGSKGAGLGRSAAAAVAPARAWTPGVNPWIIAVSVMLATFMEVLDTSVANVALPHIAGNLSASTDESTWVLTSYLVSNAIVLPATNWISHYFGRKRFLIACVTIFTLSSALCGAATSLPVLILARVLQGAGGGALQPISQAVLLESFPPEKRGQAMALFGVGIIVAPIIGPTLGGWITDIYGSIALLPLFLQTLLGYPATASGMAVSPRGFGSIISMIIVGRLVGRVDGRWLIMFGFLVLAYSTHMLAGLNLDIAMSNIVWPMVISGFAMGFIFVPLTTMAMGTLPNEQMGNATGVFNLMRNTGGSIGIAAVTTLLSRGAQTHQAVIASHMTPYDPAFQQRMEQIQGATGAAGGMVSPEALASVYGVVVRQSMLLSFMDNFRLLAFLCLLCVPAALLFRRVKAKGGPVAMH